MPPRRVLSHPEMDPPPATLRRLGLFFDTVFSVVPDTMTASLSPHTQEFATRMPGAFDMFAPPRFDDTDSGFRERLTFLDRAFAEIRSELRDKIPGIRVVDENGEVKAEPDLVTDAEGRTRVRDCVFMHETKLHPDVLELVRKHGLLPPPMPFIKPVERSPSILMEERASNLILSLLADDLARPKGIDTFTEEPLDFALVSAARRRGRVDPGGVASQNRAAVASVLLGAIVPDDIALYTFEDYVELRKAYEGAREAFGVVVRSLTAEGNLDQITDPAELGARIEEIEREFRERLQVVRDSRWARRFRSWGPTGLSVLIGVAGALLVGPAAVTLAGIGPTTSILERRISKAARRHEDEYVQFANLNDDVSRYLKRLL